MAQTINRWWQQWMIASDEVHTRASDAFRISPNAGGGHGRSKLALQLHQLEPRLLFSATPLDVAAMAGADVDGGTEVAAEVAVAEPEADSIQTLAESTTANQITHEIVFIDSAVPDLQQLLDDLSNSDRNLEVFLLDSDRDGIDQITEILDSRSDVSSIHIVSHAEDNAVKLGNLWLSEANLDGYAGQLASWQSSLTIEADILLYGCDLASDVSGQTLLDSISALTGADVAASDDDTGHASYNADWDLEYASGSIQTQVAFSEDLQDTWLGKLNTITVDTLVDEDNGNASTSLREAIDSATAGDTIILGSGTYNLTIGTLEIDKNLTIIGTDARSTIIDGSALSERVFHLTGTAEVSMSRMTIQGGDENNGGGIFVDGSTILNLSDAHLTDNNSNDGGAIHVHGTLHADRVLFTGNTADVGGAIHFHDSEDSTLTNVTISGNAATGDGGGIYVDTNNTVTITNSTITLNTADSGGGIVQVTGAVNISNTIVAGNLSSDGNKDVLGAFVSNDFNLIEVVGSAFGFNDDLTGISAGLGALANNGGQTDTHALLANSAALNAGGNSGSASQDQAGNTRDSIPDIGAFESGLQSTKLYWADQGSDSIFRSNGDGTAVQEIASGLGSPSGLEVDLVGGKLYWIETDTNSLHWSNLDGSGAAIIASSSLKSPTGLGLDLVNGHLYVADDGDGIDDAIRRFNLDGTGETTIASNLNGVLGDVAVDAVGSRIYYTVHRNGSFDGKIISITLTGTGASELVGSLTGPRSLVIDQAGGRLYFTDDGSVAGFNSVVGINLSDGGNVETLASATLSAPFGIAVDAASGKVYWSDAANNFIHRSNLDGSSVEITHTGLSSPHEIVVVPLAGSAPVGQADTYTINEDTTLDSNSDWFDSAWGFRKTLSFDNSSSSENLNDFPVLIQLDSSRIDYSQTQDAGEDLRFVDGDGNVLAHEIESWDESGTSYVWVNVPTIDQTSETDFIWMYYENGAASDGQNASGVWSTSYEAVYHLDNALYDGTSNNNDGTNAGATYVTGRIGDALSFDVSNDIVTIPSSASVDDIFAGGGTVSAWFNAAGWGENDFGRILEKSSGTTPSPNGWSLQLDGVSQTLLFDYGFSGNHGQWRVQSGSVTLGQWHQVMVVYDPSSAGNDPIIYLDGVAQTLIESQTPTGTAHSDAGLDLQIGNTAAATRTFDGLIDEIRISSTAVSAQWVEAQYESGTNSLVTFGYQQTKAGVLGNDIDADGNTLSASLVGGDPTNASAFNLNSDGTFTYTPDANFVGTDSFTYQVSDGTTWSDPVTVTINVDSVNDAPTFNNATLASTTEDSTNPAGDAVANLFGGSFTDVDDSSSMTGIVVVANAANSTTQGVWQYSTDNTNWSNIGSVDDAGNGLLISASSKIRFVPVADFNGTVTSLVVRAADNSYGGTFSSTNAGESRQTADTSSLTPSSSFGNSTNTLGTSVNGTNDLPTIGGTADGTADDNATTQPFSTVTITEVDGENVTVVVTITDGDTRGAFTAASLTASGFTKTGAGLYTRTSGSAANAQAAIRQLVFDPTENQVASGSTVTTNFTIAVDDTNPAVVDSTTDITVTSINDAPTISAATLAAIAEDDSNPPGETISNLFGSDFNDVDPSSSFAGIVVVGNSANAGSQGAWQYSSNNSDWFDIAAVNDSGNGLAIAAGSKIRFVPVTDFNGTPTALIVRGLDNTFAGTFSTTASGQSRQTVDTTSPVASSPISNATTTLSTSVTANAAPIIDGTVSTQAINDDQTATPLSTVNFSDNENDSITVVVTLSGGDANGQFTTASLTSSGFTKTDIGEYSRAPGTTASAQTAIRSLVFTPTQNQVAVGSTVNTTFQIAINDGGTTSDSNTTVTVTSVNDVATDITLSNASVSENADGAVIGSVGIVDPDAGDTHTWAVNDARFEIVGTTLKLRTGQSLDRESEPTISITITATDEGGTGLGYSESFTIVTDNVNESPTDVTLDNTTIQGGSSGDTVGQVAAIDPDNGDTHTWQVDDSRFSINGDVLKLRLGQSIDANSEPVVTLVITATDADGLTYAKSFTITVTPAAIPIPIVPVGGEGPDTPPPTESPDGDKSNEEPTENTDSSDSDSSERSSEEEASSSTEEANSTAASVKIGVAPGTIADKLSAASVAASSIVITDVGQGSGADGKASIDAMFLNSFLNASSAIGSSSSIAVNTTLDRVASGLMRYGLGTTSFAASQANLTMMMKPGAMWNELDQQLQGIESQIQGDLIIVGAAGAATSSFMVGVAAWGLRTGFLASGLMAQLPAWRAVDPLLIMQGAGDGDNESLEDLMKRRSEELDEIDESEHSVGEAIS